MTLVEFENGYWHLDQGLRVVGQRASEGPGESYEPVSVG